MAYEEVETYETPPLIVRIFDTIRELTLHIGAWLFLGISLAMIVIGTFRLVF